MNTQQRETKQHKKFNYRSTFGKSRIDIECPFCFDITTCYIWSLAGSGKKCKCGALHGNFGVTLAPVKK